MEVGGERHPQTALRPGKGLYRCTVEKWGIFVYRHSRAVRVAFYA